MLCGNMEYGYKVLTFGQSTFNFVLYSIRLKSRKPIFTLLACFWALFIHAQQDTVVVYDYTNVLLQVSPSGISPQPNLDEASHVGFFILEKNQDYLLICNDNPFYLWSDGTLLNKFQSCQTVIVSDLYTSQSDSIFVTISSKEGFANFRCEKVIFEPNRA